MPTELTQSVRATNESPDAAPWGTGPHPYLVAGEGHVDEWTLELPAGEVLAVTADRLIPTELRAVDADDAERFDFRGPRRIGRSRSTTPIRASCATRGIRGRAGEGPHALSTRR